MSTVNFGYGNAGIGETLPWDDDLGHHAVLVETVFTGTGAVIQIRALGNGNVYAAVDGAETLLGTYTSTGDQTTFTAAAGLTEGDHALTVRITGEAGYNATQFLQIAGAAPALVLPATFGPSYYFEGNSYIQADGVKSLGTGGSNIGPHSTILVTGGTAGGRCVMRRFLARITSLRVMGFFSGIPGTVTNGAIKIWRRAAGTKGEWIEVGSADLSYYAQQEWHFGATLTGLDGSKVWEYAVVYVGIGSWYLAGIAVTGTGLVTSPFALQQYVGWWGDSITADFDEDDHSQGFVYQVTRDMGLTCWNGGAPGETLAAAVTRSSTLSTQLTTPPVAMVVLEGVNDGAEGGVGIDAFQTHATQLLANIAAAFPAAAIPVLGILPQGGFATHPNTDARWAAAVATQAKATFQSTDDWILNSAPDLFPDLVHPTLIGDTKITAQIRPLLMRAILTTAGGGVISVSHPDYEFSYASAQVYLARDYQPLKWSVTRADGTTPATPISALITVRDNNNATIATLAPDLDPAAASGSIVLAALWSVPATVGSYTAQLTLTMPGDGQISSDRQIVLVR